MSFITNQPASFGAGKQDTERIAAAIAYLRQGRSAQTFLILSESGAEKEPSARFALGLCYFHANDLSTAISYFEQALQLLRAVPPGLQKAAENTDPYLKLAAAQVENKIYLTPMDADFCTLFPKTAEQTVLLALIDSYLQKGMNEKAQQLSSGLIGPVFEAYKKKLAENR
ncbi:MAG: tetratricopeptide repeat protein [Methanimicrococcus sp.]|nr:tetratricopeptide repeat protein [Methanimicrococcus sp.]MCL2142226.1 tetratricopeptide repeat protein [Methanimicrococcus sp.]